MVLAAGSLIEHINDQVWYQVTLFGMKVTVLSSGIVAMLIVAVLIPLIVLPLARRSQNVPAGGRNVLEVMVLFVRDMIAKPALHDRAYEWLAYLTTLFLFILGMNVLGLVPLRPITAVITHVLHLGPYSFGGTATSILSVCGALAVISFATLAGQALGKAAKKCRERYKLPRAICAALSPLLWVASFAPPVKGVTAVFLLVPLTLLEFIGVIAKCFALMIRLFANMISGHTLLAVLAIMAIDSVAGLLREKTMHALYVGPVIVLSSVILNIMELLVAVIQAYVFTFLTAMFLALYSDPEHAH